MLRDLFEGDEPRAQAASLAFERSFRAAAQRFGLDLSADVADAMGKTAGSGARILIGMGSGRRAAALLEAGATHVLDSITTLPDLVAKVSSAS